MQAVYEEVGETRYMCSAESILYCCGGSIALLCILSSNHMTSSQSGLPILLTSHYFKSHKVLFSVYFK